VKKGTYQGRAVVRRKTDHRWTDERVLTKSREDTEGRLGEDGSGGEGEREAERRLRGTENLHRVS